MAAMKGLPKPYLDRDRQDHALAGASAAFVNRFGLAAEGGPLSLGSARARHWHGVCQG
jgi:hypothetical protein